VRRPCAHLVVDLGFGDAGKGHVVDALVRRTGARWVVRANGGAQAGHTVVLDDGRAHTFAQIGAGTFVAGVRTWLAEGMVVHPLALALEAEVLASKGVGDALARVSASTHCRVITPWHQAANRLRERARGAARHGSCGVGFGETVADALAHPEDTVRLGMLRDPSALRPVLERVRARKREEVRALDVGDDDEMRAFEDDSLVPRWLERTAAIGRAIDLVEPDRAPPIDGDVVFEGAQGVLLDEIHGFAPHTTWSSCTFAPQEAELDRWGWPHPRRRIGVLRTYHVRHGPGPFPTETAALDVLPEPHNVDGPWQGRFRRGFFDLVLARRALSIVGGIDTLALTHLDALARDLPSTQWCVATDAERLVELGRDTEARTQRLCAAIRDALVVDIGLRSHGPRSSDVVGS
jgi:adenylosuccinate synthase